MSKKFPWFRLYANDLLGDRKIKRIQKITGISFAEIRGVWLTLLCLASESPERGVLLFDGGIPYDYDDLVEECGMDSLKFHTLFMHFTKMQMVSFDEESGIYLLPAWGARQPVGDTTGAERVRKHREKKKQERVTLQERYSNALEEEEESEKEEAGAAADSNYPPTMWTDKDVVRFLADASGVAVKASLELLGNVKKAIIKYGEEETRKALITALDNWKTTKGKNGQFYSIYTPGWIEWGIEYLITGNKRWDAVKKLSVSEMLDREGY